MLKESKKNNQQINPPEVPEKILEDASKWKLVIFLGVGVSQIINCPSWQDFAKK